ncbi:MAG: hypothetical protein IR527_01000 [Bacteroides sp.]|nr:MAG: hypothetical protein IR527_01000 [Bacteroides sp.]
MKKKILLLIIKYYLISGLIIYILNTINCVYAHTFSESKFIINDLKKYTDLYNLYSNVKLNNCHFLLFNNMYISKYFTIDTKIRYLFYNNRGYIHIINFIKKNENNIKIKFNNYSIDNNINLLFDCKKKYNKNINNFNIKLIHNKIFINSFLLQKVKYSFALEKENINHITKIILPHMTCDLSNFLFTYKIPFSINHKIDTYNLILLDNNIKLYNNVTYIANLYYKCLLWQNVSNEIIINYNDKISNILYYYNGQVEYLNFLNKKSLDISNRYNTYLCGIYHINTNFIKHNFTFIANVSAKYSNNNNNIIYYTYSLSTNNKIVFYKKKNNIIYSNELIKDLSLLWHYNKLSKNIIYINKNIIFFKKIYLNYHGFLNFKKQNFLVFNKHKVDICLKKNTNNKDIIKYTYTLNAVYIFSNIENIINLNYQIKIPQIIDNIVKINFNITNLNIEKYKIYINKKICNINMSILIIINNMYNCKNRFILKININNNDIVL